MAEDSGRQSLADLFENNPAYADLYARAIELCERRLEESAAIDAVQAEKKSISQMQDAASVLNTLARRGAIDRLVFVNGEQYFGTLQDLQSDEALGDDLSLEYFLEATPEGIAAVAAYRESKSMDSLFKQVPEHKEGFLKALEACAGEQGATTAEVQQVLADAGIVGTDAASAQVLHASYFTSKLERFGALAWEGKRWHVTQKGAAVLSVSK